MRYVKNSISIKNKINLKCINRFQSQTINHLILTKKNV